MTGRCRQRNAAYCAMMFAHCLNPDFQDFRISKIIKNDVRKSGKSLNQANRGSDKRADIFKPLHLTQCLVSLFFLR